MLMLISLQLLWLCPQVSSFNQLEIQRRIGENYKKNKRKSIGQNSWGSPQNSQLLIHKFPFL